MKSTKIFISSIFFFLILLLCIGTKEMAFVHAISSAGVAHALTKACSAGELENCGCDHSLKGTSPEGAEQGEGARESEARRAV